MGFLRQRSDCLESSNHARTSKELNVIASLLWRNELVVVVKPPGLLVDLQAPGVHPALHRVGLYNIYIYMYIYICIYI